MNLIGKVVYHYQLDGIANSRGIIIDADLDEKAPRIWVKFNGRPKMQFVFPDAFVETSNTRKFLWTEDSEINHLVEQQYCSECGTKLKSSPILINDHRLCPECAKNWKSCSECKKLVHKTDLTYYVWRNAWLCNDCLNKDHFKCAECGEWHSKDAMAISDYYPEQKQYCFDCADVVFGLLQCTGCNKFFPEGQLQSFDGDYGDFYCPECIAKYSHKCDKCGKLISSKDGTLCNHCRAQNAFIEQFSDISLFSSALETVNVEGGLLRNWKTTHIMSRLNHTASSDPIDVLVLKNYMTTRLKKTLKTGELSLPIAIDLVVINSSNNKSGYENGRGCTATELKTDKGGIIRRHLRDFILSPLNVFQISNVSCFFLMDGAYTLSAKTYGDMDYRKEWHGPYYYEEYNNYGDTSSFNIIGGIVRIDAPLSSSYMRYLLNKFGIDVDHFNLIDFC